MKVLGNLRHVLISDTCLRKPTGPGDNETQGSKCARTGTLDFQLYADTSLNTKLCGQIHICFQHLLTINVHIITKPVNVQVITTLYLDFRSGDETGVKHRLNNI
jgi:hypothetical protein